MVEKRDPPIPEAITHDLLTTTSDDIVEDVLINHVLHIMEHRPDVLEHLPPALQAHYVAYMVDCEVLNGGFNQLFFNKPAMVEDAAEAFEFLGMDEAASLASRASELYRGVRSRHDAARREGTLEAFARTYDESPFEELDNLYAERQETWRLQRLAYIRAHPEEFVHK
jgi:hypothetical protein